MLHLGIHYFLHLIFPGIVAYTFFRLNWKKAWLIMLFTMLIDLDHFLAVPIYSADRCSIGFHPLHSYYAMGLYVLLFLYPKIRLIGLGLLLHVLTDLLNCFLL